MDNRLPAVAIIAIIMGAGLVINEQNKDKIYWCNSLDAKLATSYSECDHLSSTSRTCYQTKNLSPRKSCAGTWVKVDLNVVPDAKTNDIPASQSVPSGDYTLSPDGKTCYIKGFLNQKGTLTDGICKV